LTLIVEHEDALSRKINLFLGAGFSTHAQDAQGNDLPVGNKLRDELIADFHVDQYRTLQLPQLCAFSRAQNAMS
jgi:hypothetical protein